VICELDLAFLCIETWCDPMQRPAVQRPTTFDLVVNLQDAKALGPTVPPSILARDDRGDRVSGLARLACGKSTSDGAIGTETGPGRNPFI
jgi:hypothetical protein